MAGRPGKAAMVRAIEAEGGEVALLDMIEQGQSVSSIARALGFHGNSLGAWLNRTPESKAALSRAREGMAHALADEALDEARATIEDNHKSKSVKIKALQWHAGKLNRAQYGETPMVAIQFNVGDLALEALKQTPPAIPQHLVVEAKQDSDSGVE